MLFVFFFVIIAYWYVSKLIHFWDISTKVPIAFAHPLFGNVYLFAGTTADITGKFINLMSKFRKRIGLWTGPIFTLYVFNPEDIEVILRSKYMEKGDGYSTVFTSVTGESSFTLNSGLKLKNHKKVITPWFRLSNLKNFVELFNDNGNDLIKSLNKYTGREVDIEPEISSAVMTSLLGSLTGLDKKYVKKFSVKLLDLLPDVISNITQRMFKIWLGSDTLYYLLGKRKSQDEFLKLTQELVDKAVTERTKALDERRDFNVFIDYVKGASFSDQMDFSKEDMLSEIRTMLIAGFITSKHTICLCLSLLGLHKEVQEKLFEEVESILGQSDNEFISFEDIIKMEYMDRVLQETWRLYPPATFMTKKPSEDIFLDDGNIKVPKGTVVAIMVHTLHRDPEIYPNPEKYNPDNFLPENVEKRHPYSFIPFSLGSRACIGQKYAHLSVKFYLAKIIKNFKIHSNHPEKTFQLSFEIALKRNEGYPLVFEKR